MYDGSTLVLVRTRICIKYELSGNKKHPQEKTIMGIFEKIFVLCQISSTINLCDLSETFSEITFKAHFRAFSYSQLCPWEWSFINFSFLSDPWKIFGDVTLKIHVGDLSQSGFGEMYKYLQHAVQGLEKRNPSYTKIHIIRKMF